MKSKKEILLMLKGKKIHIASFENGIVINESLSDEFYAHTITNIGDDIFETKKGTQTAVYSISHIIKIYLD